MDDYINDINYTKEERVQHKLGKDFYSDWCNAVFPLKTKPEDLVKEEIKYEKVYDLDYVYQNTSKRFTNIRANLD